MIAVLKHGIADKQIEGLSTWLKAQGLDVHISRGSEHTVIGLIGAVVLCKRALYLTVFVDGEEGVEEKIDNASRNLVGKCLSGVEIVKVFGQVHRDLLTLVLGVCVNAACTSRKDCDRGDEDEQQSDYALFHGRFLLFLNG